MTNTDLYPSKAWGDLAAQVIAETDPAKRAALFDQMHAAYLAEARGATTQSGLPYPAPTDPIAQGADAIRALAEALESPRTLKRFYTPVSYTLTTANVNLPGVTMSLDVKAGQKYNIVARITAWNAASGNPKTVTFRITENGVNLTPTITWALPFVTGSTAATCVIEIPRTAAADATMTYTVGGLANAASSCSVTDAEIEAISMPASASQEMAVGEEEIAAIEEALAAERLAAEK